MQQRQVMKMTLRKVFGVLTILCLLTLTGAAIPAPAAQETSQPAPEIRNADPTAVRLAIGDELEYALPMDTMEIIGRYNVTIDPTENFTVEPLNLDSPLEVKRNTPIGALDAVARSGELNYTTYYYTVSDKLVIDSINGYVYQEDQVWFALYDLNETFYETSRDTKEHNISDGETLWFIYCDLSDYDPRYESRTDRAVAGLSITVTYGEETVTPPIVSPIPTEQKSLDAVIGENSNLSILASLLNATDLPATLQDRGPYTVFAPSNDAFGNLSPETLAAILTDSSERTRVLSNHVVNGSYTAAELLNMTQSGNLTPLTTLAGENLTVSESDGELMVDGATVRVPEISASNGFVYIIDRVLIPPENTTGQPEGLPR
jgi:uncharacterized surface protein with fasciclin (FAS1) repeats